MNRFASDPVSNVMAAVTVTEEATNENQNLDLVVAAFLDNFTEDEVRDMLAQGVGLICGFVNSLSASKGCTFAEMVQEITVDMRALLDS